MKFNTEIPDEDNQKLIVEFENLTQAQTIAIKELMAVWQFIIDKKFFYWTAFCIDGFLDWNAKIKVDGVDPERYMDDIGDRSGKIKIVQSDGTLADEEMYFLDYMKIQMKLNENKKVNSNSESE